MVYDHDAIRQLTARIQEASNHDVSPLQELLYGLHALITVHFRKEEELYLPLLEREPADQVHDVLAEMGQLGSERPHHAKGDR
jgi:iron-sulfur cluster repair protein YtfE (RIC family)